MTSATRASWRTPVAMPRASLWHWHRSRARDSSRRAERSRISAASGVSGAGASPKLELLFAEVTEDFRAYGVGNAHRHLFEMRATMAKLGPTATCCSRRTCCRSTGNPVHDHRAAHARPRRRARAVSRRVCQRALRGAHTGLPRCTEVQHRNVVRIGARIPRACARLRCSFSARSTTS
jgi:hypothetical protein